MPAKLEKIDSIRQSLEIDVTKDIVAAAKKVALGKIRAEVKLPGFRKGKVPDHMLIQKFGDEVAKETIREIAQKTYPAAVVEAGVNPISAPSIVPLVELSDGADFRYKATFETYPEVNVTGYEGLALEREKVDVSETEVENEIKRLQMQMTQLEPSPDGILDKGMIALLDFSGTAGGEKFQGSEAENYVVDYGSGNLLQEFEVQIKGMKAGESRDIEFDYPSDYFRKEIAGKRGKFNVKAKEIRKKIVPAIDDEFAKNLGKFKDMAELRDEMKKRIGDYKEHLVKNSLMEQAVRKLIEKSKDMDVPTPLIDSELGNMLEQLKRQYESRGQTLDVEKIDAKEFVKANVEEATNRARGYMLVSAISTKEGIQVADEEVEERIKQMSAQSRQPVEKIKAELEKENRMTGLRSQMVFEKTLDFVLSKAKIKEVKPKKEKK